VLDSLGASGTISFALSSREDNSVQGTEAAITASVTATDFTNLADAINSKTAQTGINAILSEDKASITLENSTGYDIGIGDFSHSTATTTIDAGGVTLTDAGADSISVGGKVDFSSDKSYSVTSTGTGVFATAATHASSLSSIADVNVTTQAGANSALDVIDQALAGISNQRAGLGAVQNRLDSTIANLSGVSENVSAARSRIMDADFAAETASLTRSQILQQAGTAMLSQANSAPNSVLSLLQ
jgi:flagellin